MFILTIKKCLIFLLPAAILIITWLLVPHVADLSPAQQEMAAFAPYVITAMGMLLSVHFHRGRPFMALLMLVLFYWSSRAAVAAELFEPALNVIYQYFIILIPLNMVLLTLMRERGVFSTVGRMRLVFLTIEAAGAFWLLNRFFVDIVPYIAKNYVQWPVLAGFLVPQPALVAGALCFAAIAVLALRRQTPVESGMLGALTSFFVICNWLTTPDIPAAFSTAGALILTMSVLRDSYNMAFRDDLTGMPSRRSLNECLHGLGRRYTVAMLDVDHFKKFNDTYGHDVGDQVLKMVARKMMEIGGGGKAYRYGGEEFTIVFLRSRPEDALPHLEELRKTIANYQMTFRSGDRPKDQQQGKGARGSRAGRSGDSYASVTVSIGVAEGGEELKSAAEVMKAADKALYKAKNRGRNQISR